MFDLTSLTRNRNLLACMLDLLRISTKPLAPLMVVPVWGPEMVKIDIFITTLHATFWFGHPTKAAELTLDLQVVSNPIGKSEN